MKKVFKKAKNIYLTKNERAEMSANLSEYIKNNPLDVRTADDLRQIRHWPYLINLTNSTMAIIIFLIAALSLGGGTALAAEQAVPGDFLYPIKITLNEGVISALAITDEQEAEWQAKLAERRLEEAEELAAEDKLDKEVEDHLLAQFEKHLNKLSGRIEKLKAAGKNANAAKVLSKLESILEAHEVILDALENEDGDTEDEDGDEDTDDEDEDGDEDGDKDSLQDAVEEFADSIEEEREELDKELDDKNRGSSTESQHAAEGKKKSMANKLAEVERFIIKMEGKSDKQLFEARKVLEEARAQYTEAVTLLEAESYNEAFRLFQEAHRLVDSAKKLAKAEGKLEIRERRDHEREQKREDKDSNDEEDDDSDEDKYDDEENDEGDDEDEEAEDNQEESDDDSEEESDDNHDEDDE